MRSDYTTISIPSERLDEMPREGVWEITLNAEGLNIVSNSAYIIERGEIYTRLEIDKTELCHVCNAEGLPVTKRKMRVEKILSDYLEED